jgi:hypothetical protein
MGYSGTLWQSPDMPEADDFWVGIRPQFPLVGTTGSGASPIWLIARSETDLISGDTVKVAGVLGNTAANQTNGAVVAVAPRHYFWRFQPQRELGGALPGELASIDASGGKCVARFTVPHGLSAGWVIEVVGSPTKILGGVPSMTPKLYTITSVLDTQSFAFNCTGVADGTYDRDYAPDLHFVIIALPGVAIGGTGTGTYSGGGTLISTSNQHGFAEVHLPRFQPYGSKPLAPANLTAAVTGSDLTLTWQDRSNDENDFVVERRSGTGSFQTIAVTRENATSYTDPGMPAGVVYCYRVHARNAVGDSDYSNEASAEVPVPPAPPKAPANLQVANVLSDSLRLEWGDLSDNEDYFRIEADSGDGYRLVRLVNGNVTSLQVTELEPQTTFIFRVQAGNDLGVSSWAVSLPVATLATIPWRTGRRTSTAALLYYRTPDGAPCTVTTGGNTLSDARGVTAREMVLTGLAPESINTFSLLCPGGSASGTGRDPRGSQRNRFYPRGGKRSEPVRRGQSGGSTGSDSRYPGSFCQHRLHRRTLFCNVDRGRRYCAVDSLPLVPEPGRGSSLPGSGKRVGAIRNPAIDSMNR